MMVKGWNPLADFGDFINALKYMTAKRAWLADAENAPQDENEGMSPEEKCEKYGYKLVKHEVVTEDGYILEMHQVHKGGMFVNTWYPAVLMQHGLSSSSEFWLKNGDKSAAFLLADAGYNVFLGNNRGNKFSRKHKTLDLETDGEKYFDYSFYELGAHDLPAMVDAIYKLTWKKTISYIGHSQGTSQMFSALA
jgi:lysosomal acid lipase/cholesteryl ester hydrolase